VCVCVCVFEKVEGAATDFKQALISFVTTSVSDFDGCVCVCVCVCMYVCETYTHTKM
jgi:hypothetical protein